MNFSPFIRRRNFTLAKVGVERSNRFTRSNYQSIEKLRSSVAFSFFGTIEIGPHPDRPGVRVTRGLQVRSLDAAFGPLVWIVIEPNRVAVRRRPSALYAPSGDTRLSNSSHPAALE
jgi:hypothetical protein